MGKMAVMLTMTLAILTSSMIVAQSTNATSGTTSSPTGTPTATGSGAASSPSSSIKVSLPPLLQCQTSTWAFSGAPANVPKHLGFYVTGTQSFLEVYDLPDIYTPLTDGTFTWVCDFPVGLSVAAQIWAQDPVSGILSQASTTDTIVAAGTSSSCLAQNSGQNTKSIISLASSLDPAFRASSLPVASQTGGAGGGSGSGATAGAIAGGVVGGLALLAIIALILLFFKRRHDKARFEGSQWGGASEKYGPASTLAHGQTGPGQAGFYVPYDEYGRPLGDEAYGPVGHTTTVVPETPVATRPMAAPGTLPEPMDAESESRHHIAPSEIHGSPPPQGHSPFAPITEGESMRSAGTEDLDDPSTFSPVRHNFQRSLSGITKEEELEDPSSFSPKGRDF